MSRFNVEHFMNRYFDLVQQNREIHSRTLAYQNMQDTYMNSMITLMQTQGGHAQGSSMQGSYAHRYQTTGSTRQRNNRFSPSVRTAYFDLGTLFSDVIVRPTRQEIRRATRELQFSEIEEPQNSRCPISQQDFSQNDTVSQIRHCGHIFYPNEINTWWERNVRCPVCRYDIREHRSENTSGSSSRNEPNVDGTEDDETEEAGNEATGNVTMENEAMGGEDDGAHVELNNSTSQSERTTSRRFTTYDNQTSIPRIRTIPRTTFSRTSRAIQPNPDTNISDQEFTSYVNLATQLLNNFSQGDISGSVDILYSIQ
tara:strand:+ start:1043 stop:1978 length:936 start_codon:yes stop_codon:yes gene_type:complete